MWSLTSLSVKKKKNSVDFYLMGYIQLKKVEKKNIFWLNKRKGYFSNYITNCGQQSRRRVGKGIKFRDLLAPKTTGTHVGFWLTDKNATFNLCPISRSAQSYCLNILDQIAKFRDVVQRISSQQKTYLSFTFYSFFIFFISNYNSLVLFHSFISNKIL